MFSLVGETMGKLYDDLLNIVDFEPDKEEELKTEKYCKNFQRMGDYYNTFIPIGVLFVFFLYLFGGYIGCFLFVLFMIIAIFLYKRYLKKNKIRINNLVNECSANKALTAYMVIARYHVRSTKKLGSFLACIGSALIYQGRFAEAKSVLDLIEKYCDTLEGRAYKIISYAAIALYEKDREAIESYINEFGELLSQVNTPYMEESYNRMLNYPLILEVEENGDYTKALEFMVEKEKGPLLYNVSVHYRLYNVAKSAGMQEEALKHRAFVLENGGDTFYKKELELIG